MKRIRWLILLIIAITSPAMAKSGNFEWLNSAADSNVYYCMFGSVGYSTATVTSSATVAVGVSSATCTEPLAIPVNSDVISIAIRSGTDKIKSATTLAGTISSASFDIALFPDAKEARLFVDNFSTYLTAANPSVYFPYSTGNGAAVAWYAANVNMTAFGNYTIPAGANRFIVLRGNFDATGAAYANAYGYIVKVRFGRSAR